jgi:hypothetical protein
MVGMSDIMLRVLGIRAYEPGAIPRAKVRRPKTYGSRSRWYLSGLPSLRNADDFAIARLSQQHRIIRQMIADAERSRWRGGT